MNDRERLAERFEQQRPYLRALAYRTLGSLSEADDTVQDTWLRLSETDSGAAQSMRAWLTTITARVSLNMLRSRRYRRERAVATHVPDPVVSPPDGLHPERSVHKGDSHAFLAIPVAQSIGESVADVALERPKSKSPANAGKWLLRRFGVGRSGR